MIIRILTFIVVVLIATSSSEQPHQQQQIENDAVNLVNSYYLNLINLIEPKLRIYLRELKYNSLLLLLYVEPKMKEIEIAEYQVNYINKISNKELMKIELNSELSKRLLVELKDLYQNTPYKICIQAKLQVTCSNNHVYTANLTKTNGQKNFEHTLSQYCNLTKSMTTLNTTNGTVNNDINEAVNRNIIINNCIDNITTQKSVSLQALGSSLGAILSLLIIMSCIYMIQSCKPGRAFQKLRCRKPFVNDA